MKNKRLALVNRAKMSTLNAIRRFKGTDAEEHLQFAVQALNRAKAKIINGGSGTLSLENAQYHLQHASFALGFSPVTL